MESNAIKFKRKSNNSFYFKPHKVRHFFFLQSYYLLLNTVQQIQPLWQDVMWMDSHLFPNSSYVNQVFGSRMSHREYCYRRTARCNGAYVPLTSAPRRLRHSCLSSRPAKAKRKKRGGDDWVETDKPEGLRRGLSGQSARGIQNSEPT